MNKNRKILLLAFFTIAALLLALFIINYISWKNNHQDKLPAKTFLEDLDISGYNKQEVKNLLNEKELAIKKAGLIFKSGETTLTLPLFPVYLSSDIPDLSLKYEDSIYYDQEKTINNLFSSQKNSFLYYLYLKYFNKTNNNSVSFYYNLEIIIDWLKENFSDLILPPESAYFSIENIDGQKNIITNQEKIGKDINLTEIENDLIKILTTFENQTIIIKTKTTYPSIKKEELEPLRGQVESIISLGQITLLNKLSEETFKVPVEEVVTWISSEKDDNILKMGFEKNKIINYLSEEISPKVNKEVVLPRFDLKNGKVSSWQTGSNGLSLDLITSSEKIMLAVENKTSEVGLVLEEIKVDDLNIENNFKIKDLLGTGYSNFKGSPVNRRHNIKTGAEAVHGLLIKPNEEFSLVKALGVIDASTGYLPELVIKGDKTIPEYGGGLCQIATTLFRSALSTGLPITARRNHSYRVSYYEPAGTDAAVYDPWPDIKFLNDTNNYILIQSRIAGDEVYFDFWGTSDGRTATTTKPVVYNIVEPAPTKFIETDALLPGAKKCTERAHNGADAYFDYLVVYPEGATTTPRQEVRFSSHYVPWQEVCLIGKKTATTTDVILNVDPTLNTNNTSSSTEITPTAPTE